MGSCVIPIALLNCFRVCFLICFILGQYVDLDYSIWLYRLLTPLMMTFVLPSVFVLLIYLSISFLYVYKLHRLVRDFFVRISTVTCFYNLFSRFILQVYNDGDFDFWDVARTLVAVVWDAHGWIFHGNYIV